jgi:hypothetical protein
MIFLSRISNILNGLLSAVEYPDLLPFWLFAREMISNFKECHLRFHNQIGNIFKLIGSADEEHIGRDTFPDFIGMVNPEIRDSKIKEMWQSMIQFDSGSADRTTVPIQMFERFCRDYPGMTRWIEELPFLDGFDRVYKVMTEPMLTFFSVF